MSKVIGLQIPERHPANKDGFDCRPAAVSEWIETLPRASVGRCAELLYKVLYETNHIDMRYQDRMRMLEAFREPLQYVTLGMQKHFVSTAFPLPSKNKKIANATRELFYMMATGYKIAIEDLLSSRVILLDKQLLTTMIHRAVSYLSRVLLTTYHMYAPLPKYVWNNLHKLYRYAEQHKRHMSAVSDNQLQYIKKTSISDEYIRTLLLSLASPHHLRSGEVDKVYVNLERWMGLPTLSHVTGGDVGGDFLVDIESDAPPHYVAIGKENPYADNIRILDTSHLKETVFGELQMSEEIVSKTLVSVHMSKANLSHELLRLLAQAWGAIPKRAFERNDCNINVKITVGLSATHQEIFTSTSEADLSHSMSANADQLMHLIDTQSYYQSKDVSHVDDEKPDVWDMVYDNGKLQKVRNNQQSKQDGQRISNPSQVSCAMDGWHLINQSANGYCLQCTSDCGSNIQVGELIGLHSQAQAASKNRTIGVIQWIRSAGDKGIKVGGQLLGCDAIPVGIGLAGPGGKQAQAQRALLLPAVKLLGRPSTLITLGSPFRVGQTVMIYLQAGSLCFKLTHEREEIGFYNIFEYEHIIDTGALKNTEQFSSAQDEPLDDGVWSSI